MALFASPAKPYLIRKLQERNRAALEKAAAAAAAMKNVAGKVQPNNEYGDGYGDNQPIMGLPGDFGEDVEEVMREIREEIEAIRGNGGIVEDPTGVEVKAAVEYKLGMNL